jgi:hypothetical protein
MVSWTQLARSGQVGDTSKRSLGLPASWLKRACRSLTSWRSVKVIAAVADWLAASGALRLICPQQVHKPQPSHDLLARWPQGARCGRYSSCSNTVERETVSAKPSHPIRRFDVFAEYRRQDEQEKGMPADQAKGYGLWVAKVVAARKFGRLRGEERPSAEERQARRRRKWHVLGGEPQTDRLFDHEIVERMGAEFYAKEFVPAIRHAREDGQSYEAIRDRIRRRWKPVR